METTRKCRIFISYSRRGNGPKWKAALLRALHVFERHHLLDVWQDGKIRVSSFWDDDIKQAMGNARLAVVLLTKEALDSEYILNTEFPFLRERQQHDKLPVFPVICEECDWRAHDWLRATQAPNESNPLSQLSEAAQDSIFRQLATDIAEELSHAALAEVPKPDQAPPPDHIYLAKFPLTRRGGSPEKLIGREQELALLDLAFAQPHTAIVSLVAWGGVGKTMLVQHWLQRLQREGWFGARRVYAWSFYSQGTKEDRQASEDTFLAHALEWFGVQCEPTLSPWDKGRLLADAVTRERTLLILDGIEPLQYPPGPMGGQLRAPGVQSLLKQLARKANATENRGLCLVTTREPLTDVADFERRPDAAWGSVLRVDLGNLTAEAGAALLHHAGAKRAGAAEIKSDDADLLATSREVDGHALTLSLLGSFLARAHNGDIRRRDLVKFEEADRKEQGGTTFKMLAAFENWFARSGEFSARQLAVLRVLGLFDRPADGGCIAALRRHPVIAGLTDPLFTTRLDASTGQASAQPLLEEDWNTATSFLADFGLLAILNNELTQPSTLDSQPSLDCHPLIREYFTKQVSGKNRDGWRSAHARLYEHLKNSTEYRPDTLDGLQPLYQAVVHGCQARVHEDAWVKVFLARIRRSSEESYSWRRLGTFGADLGALACFFEEPWARLLPGFSSTNEALVLAETSFALRSVGRLAEALMLMRVSAQKYQSEESWQAAARVASNVSELALILGDTVTALLQAEQAVQYADRAKERFERMLTRTTLADALHQTGRRAEAVERFVEAEGIEAKDFPQTPLLHSLWGFRYCDLLLAEPELAAWQDYMARLARSDSIKVAGGRVAPQRDVERCYEVERRAAQILEYDTSAGRLLDFGLHRLTLGRAALYRAILEHSSFDNRNSALHLQIVAAVGELRQAGFQYQLPCGLLTRTWLRVLEGDAAGARGDLDDAWDIAESGPMRLHMADIHLYRARLFFREKPYPWKSPQADLAAAEKLINDCGYHRRDGELVDAKRAILGG